MLQKPTVPIDLQVWVMFSGLVFENFPEQVPDVLKCLCVIILLVYMCFILSSYAILHLQYKFAPDLIMLDAYEAVESWMTTNNLNPRKLIPAMMRYSSEPHARYYLMYILD